MQKFKAPRFLISTNELAAPGRTFIVHTYNPQFIVEVVTENGADRFGDVHGLNATPDFKRLAEAEKRMNEWYIYYKLELKKQVSFAPYIPPAGQANREILRAIGINPELLGVVNTKATKHGSVADVLNTEEGRKLVSEVQQPLNTDPSQAQDDNAARIEPHVESNTSKSYYTFESRGKKTFELFNQIISERGSFKKLGLTQGQVSQLRYRVNKGEQIPMDQQWDILKRYGATLVQEPVWSMPKENSD